MASSRMSFDYNAIGSQMLRADWMVDAMAKRAQRIMELAESRAPVYEGTGPDPTRGSYKDSFRVESTSHGGVRHNRAEAKSWRTIRQPSSLRREHGRTAGFPRCPPGTSSARR